MLCKVILRAVSNSEESHEVLLTVGTSGPVPHTFYVRFRSLRPGKSLKEDRRSFALAHTIAQHAEKARCARIDMR